MRNSSLDGALCSAQNEAANLASENKQLYASFESMEETTRHALCFAFEFGAIFFLNLDKTTVAWLE